MRRPSWSGCAPSSRADRGLPVAGGVEGEVLSLTVLTPHPGAARALFDPAAVDRGPRHARRGAAATTAAGTSTGSRWDPAVAHETRGRVTVEAIKLLRENGR